VKKDGTPNMVIRDGDLNGMIKSLTMLCGIINKILFLKMGCGHFFFILHK
jgi:hypothetical protein